MTHPITELAAAAFIIVAAVGTMFAVTPQPKPEPPPVTQAEATQEALKRCADNPERMCVVQVEPDPAKTEAERLKDVEKDLRETEVRQQKLIDRIKQVTAEEKRK